MELGLPVRVFVFMELLASPEDRLYGYGYGEVGQISRKLFLYPTDYLTHLFPKIFLLHKGSRPPP